VQGPQQLPTGGNTCHDCTVIKGTFLWSGCVTHKIVNFWKTNLHFNAFHISTNKLQDLNEFPINSGNFKVPQDNNYVLLVTKKI